MTDQCLVCGRFVGHYPVGFYCDVHCSTCRCSHCLPIFFFTPHPAPETAPGPGDNLDAGQGPCPVHRPASPGLTHPAAVAPVPGRATAHSFNTSPCPVTPPVDGGTHGEARDGLTSPVVRPATPAHLTPPAGARATRDLLRDIADKRLTRNDIAMTYGCALAVVEDVGWPTVNQAIIERWSISGLRYIKAKAWKFHQKRAAS